MSTTVAHDAPNVDGMLNNDGLYDLLKLGILVGTPILFVVALAISSLARVGMANALAISIVPALFGGVTFGGFAVLMRLLREEDRAHAAARAARIAARITAEQPSAVAA